MTEYLLTFFFYYGVAASIVTVLVGLWCWRKIQRQNELERLRHTWAGRANVKGWRL